MIKSLSIQNFQSHKDTTLELDKGVNVVVGQSDSGKTAVLRALKWLATNRPSGDAFRSRWGGDTVVGLALERHSAICRTKAKKKNEYDLILPGAEQGDEITFAAMGTDVPESVITELNLSDLSWQSQMDPPFLLSSSSGEVARALNEVADLEKIDTTLFNANRMIRENKASLLAKGQEAVQLESELIQYADVDDQLKRVGRIKELERRTDLMEQMAEKGIALLTSHEILKARHDALPDVLACELKYKLLIGNEEAASRMIEGADSGEELLTEFASLTKTASKFKRTDRAADMLDGLLDMSGKLAEQESNLTRAQNQMTVLTTKEVWLKKCENDLKGLEKTWHDSFPEICPLCNK